MLRLCKTRVRGAAQSRSPSRRPRSVSDDGVASVFEAIDEDKSGAVSRAELARFAGAALGRTVEELRRDEATFRTRWYRKAKSMCSRSRNALVIGRNVNKRNRYSPRNTRRTSGLDVRGMKRSFL